MVQLDPFNLLAGLFFSVWGFYFLKEGKRLGSPLHLGIGVTLLVFPYFVANAIYVCIIGAVLMFVGFRFRS